ncbi:Trk system potassium transporter TrkA [Lachnospira multipara]|uniref:Trk system potassium transporter TrkA n=1 Tax=Lachnospira multipara TaxID=28051 RepID=UPI0004E15B41|nr:Trk system potassium transporter TrkA [Lachnospira multipara]
MGLFKNHIEETKGLSIIIVGTGKVGTTLVEQLTKEGHNIIIIDKNKDKINTLTSMYDVMGVVGNGASLNVQKDANVAQADLLIAVTGSDELNLLCCTVAKQVSGCSAIARVRTPDYADESEYLRSQLGLAMIINPELEAAREIARLLYLPTALEVNTFVRGQADMVRFKVPQNCIMNGKTIADICNDPKYAVLICSIERNGEVIIPSGTNTVMSGDIVSFITSSTNAKHFLKKFGFDNHSVKNTMIVGGGRASFYLAKQLIKAGIDVKIIESNSNKAKELTDLLPEVTIINADGTDEEVLKEEGLSYMESFVPLTGIDEENIILTLHARQISNAKVVTKVNRMGFKKVISSLDLGSVVYPRYITSEAIVAYVRALKESIGCEIETLYHLFDSRAEGIEFKIREDSKITNVLLKDLKLKKGLLIALISRNGKIIIPSGNDEIKVGDSVVIITTHTGFGKIEDILDHE